MAEEPALGDVLSQALGSGIGKAVRVLPREAIWGCVHDGTTRHSELIGHFIATPRRFGATPPAGYVPDWSLVEGVVPAEGDVVGVTATGLVVHWPRDEFELLIADCGRA
jgi:hypothetical protein